MREALTARIQAYNNETFEAGDIVISLNKDDEWEGPAEVITREASILQILYNGNERKVAVCQARKFIEDMMETDEEAVSEEYD